MTIEEKKSYKETDECQECIDLLSGNDDEREKRMTQPLFSGQIFR